MQYILIILITMLIPFTLYADDKAMIESYGKMQDKLKTEEDPINKTVREVYQNMLKNKGARIELFPSEKQILTESKEIYKQFDIPDVKEIVDDPTCIDPERLGDFRVYVFISKSVPEKTLKNYMRDALKLKTALLVMRGVIGSADFIKPTQDFITQISCNKKLGELTEKDRCDISRVDINPLLFTLFKIDTVPAVVFTKLTYHELMLRSNLNKSVNNDEYYIIKGDMSLRYALSKFHEVGADTDNLVKILNGRYGG